MTKRQKETMLSRKETRRSFLHRGAALATVAIAAPMVIRKAEADDKVLNWLTYSGHSADEVVGPFKEATGITIKAKEYADGEKMLALIHGSPRGTFDLVTSDAPYVELLVKSGLRHLPPFERGIRANQQDEHGENPRHGGAAICWCRLGQRVSYGLIVRPRIGWRQCRRGGIHGN